MEDQDTDIQEETVEDKIDDIYSSNDDGHESHDDIVREMEDTDNQPELLRILTGLQMKNAMEMERTSVMMMLLMMKKKKNIKTRVLEMKSGIHSTLLHNKNVNSINTHRWDLI